MNNPYPIKVALIDNFYFRKGLKTTLSEMAGSSVHVIAEADNEAALVTIISTHKPDVVIAGIKAPLTDDVETIKTIKLHFPATGIIAMSLSAEKESILKMYDAGISAYLLKHVERQEILNAVQAVYKGEHYYCNFTSRVIAAMHHLDRPKKNRKKAVAYFCEKEVVIIELICLQYTTREIAAKLRLRTRTIDDYRYKIQEKMQVRNMVGIAMYAVKHGIVKVNQL